MTAEMEGYISRFDKYIGREVKFLIGTDPKTKNNVFVHYTIITQKKTDSNSITFKEKEGNQKETASGTVYIKLQNLNTDRPEIERSIKTVLDHLDKIDAYDNSDKKGKEPKRHLRFH